MIVDDRIRSCPICGSERIKKIFSHDVCCDCDEIIEPYISKCTISYYEIISFAMYGTETKWKEIFIDEELSKEVSFDLKKYHRNLENNELRKQNAETIPVYYPEEHKPKCPTCQSNRVIKISNPRRIAHGLTFGILSKTAFSQFECKNCGYKW